MAVDLPWSAEKERGNDFRVEPQKNYVTLIGTMLQLLLMPWIDVWISILIGDAERFFGMDGAAAWVRDDLIDLP